MSFQRSCLYHPTQGMRVIEENQEAEYKRLMDTGVWFDHPTKAKQFKEKPHEEPIRQQPRKGRINGEHTSKQNGSRT